MRCERDVTSETETAILENISKCLEHVFTKQLSVESVQTFKLTVRLVLYLISLELAYFQKYTYMFVSFQYAFEVAINEQTCLLHKTLVTPVKETTDRGMAVVTPSVVRITDIIPAATSTTDPVSSVVRPTQQKVWKY